MLNCVYCVAIIGLRARQIDSGITGEIDLASPPLRQIDIFMTGEIDSASPHPLLI